MFEVGDEVVVVDDTKPWAMCNGYRRDFNCPFHKGDVFIVLGVLPAGFERTLGVYLTRPCIQIGVVNESEAFLAKRFGLDFRVLDIWAVERFRKIEKKRDRQELYAMFGIDQMLTVKSGELVDAR